MALRKENTRKSKKEANGFVNGAWKSHIAQSFGGHAQLAIAFLKHPITKVHTLLRAWEEHTNSEEYHMQKARSARSESNAEWKEQQKALKIHVHSLRHQRRRAVRLSTQLAAGKISRVPPQEQWLVDRYRSGDLDTELDDFVQKHGFGKLRHEEKCFAAPCLGDWIDS